MVHRQKINTSKKINGNTATLTIGSALLEGDEEKDRNRYIVPFTKEKGNWLMADNIYPASKKL